MEKPESLEEQAAMADDPPEFEPEEEEREVAYAPDGYAVCPSCGHHTSAFCGSCTFMIPVVDGDGYIVGVTYCGCDCIVALGGKSLQETVRGWFDREQNPELCCYADRNEGGKMNINEKFAKDAAALRDTLIKDGGFSDREATGIVTKLAVELYDDARFGQDAK